MDFNVLEYRKRILDKVLAHISLTGRERTIDIGCGDGGDCELLMESVKEAVGIDVEFNSNWQKNKKKQMEFSVADVCNLPFRDGSFDLVFEKDALHHVGKVAEASKEILRITKTGGYIICVEANRYNPIFYVHMTLIRGHQHFTKNFFAELMKTYSDHVFFFPVESRIYPIKNKRLFELIHYFEDFLEGLPLIKNYLCYNVAIVKMA